MKPFKPSLSIGTKMLISHVSLAILVTALASVLSYALSSHYIRQTRIDELMVKAEHIAESARTPEDGGIMPARHTVRIYEELTDAKVFFLDAGSSDVIRMSKYHADAPEDSEGDIQWIEVLDSIDRQFAERVLAGEKVSALRRFEFAQDVIIFAGVPITDENQAIRGGVILAQPVAQLRSLSRMIRFMLAAVVGVSVLLAILMAMQEAQMLVRPLQRITRAARRMEDGVYAERISSLPANEIGDLGRALNSMSGRLMDVIRNLRKERDKLQLVISGMGEGLFAVDKRWNIVHANAAFLELTELTDASDLLDEACDSRYEPLRALLLRCMKSGQPEEIEWQNASRRAISVEASALRDENDAILGTVCLLRDVSEAQRLEQLRRDYVANISHELRTPLTGIRGMVEPLIDGCMDTEEERQESYRVILKETIRLEKLVGEMLDMSRLQDGRISVELEPMELPGILEAAVRSMSAIAEEAGVALRVETDGTRLACLGNEDRIMQVLVILLDNALSFTPRGGSVTVFARDAGSHIDVGVRDTGCGIEPKDLPLIWERFYKADRSRMRTTGTGLGLSIAKLVTQLMGGDISVKSDPGKGAEFTFTLKKA
ncbi:MAG: HAMP domain-containing protein [Clostridia bacterium]|nr:HAMP domain-containing protein [Clostridia bacterium]